MAEPLRIALAGLGTVGAGVIRLLDANRDLITRRAGREIAIVAVSARDRTKDRGVDLARFAWEDDMTAMAARGDVDVVVELVGGADGPALTLARNAIRDGKALDAAGVKTLASIPSREVLLARLLGVMQAPVSGFAVALGQLAKKRETEAA